jgi:CheY-like chemotaxis protein
MVVSYLVIDDEEDLREILVELLSGVGHRVVGVSGCEEALERLAAETFDVLITDIQMPGMSGLLLASRARERFPRLGIVIMSGREEPVCTVLEASGGGAFLQKPFRAECLNKAIEVALGKVR